MLEEEARLTLETIPLFNSDSSACLIQMALADFLIYLGVVVGRIGQSNTAVYDAPVLVGNSRIHIRLIEHLIWVLIKLFHFFQECLAGPAQIQKRTGLGRLVL